MGKVQRKRAVWVELSLWASLAFLAVLIAAWLRLPDVERGVKTLVDDIAERAGWQ